MDIEDLRARITEARKKFLDGEFSLLDENASLVHITQILTYVDLSVDDYKDIVKENKESVQKLLSGENVNCEELVSQGVAKMYGDVCVPKNSLVIEAAKRQGISVSKVWNDPGNEAVLDLSYALDSLRIQNELKIADGMLKISVKGVDIRPVIIGIAQPDKAYRKSGEDVAKLWLYVPRFLAGSLGRKLLPIIIDLGLSEALKNIPIIYVPIGILSLLSFYKRGIHAISVYTPVYRKIEQLIS